ncbi:polymerase [Sulfurifustis variabilis]|uniref:Polymerase n=1 Tax=Sulfurifustis variabilis TaxID=1675686 RepID=A0A1B4VD73_9GAMM|nr:O-antigen ligase family protein [Sulfurifustis variabilis]BAU50341.1 polymerase [Sulfurifustis variabilis]
MPASERLGIVGLYAFAIGGFFSTTLAGIGLFSMVCAFVLSPPLRAGSLWRDPMVRLLGLFLIYIALRTAWAIYEFPETASEQLDLAATWTGVWLFVFVARWLDARAIPALAGVALIGFLLGAARRQDWTELSLLIEGMRAGFGYGIPQAGLFSAVAAVGLACFAPRFLGGYRPRWAALARLVLWVGILALVIQMLLITQSRISWIAVVVIGSVTALLTISQAYKKGFPVSRARTLLALAVVGGSIIFVLFVNRDVIGLRYTQYLHSAEALSRTSDHAHDVADDPVEIRVELLRHGIERWRERPLFGWGPGTRVAPTIKSVPEGIGHLHNTYLEILVRLGLLGMAIFGAALWLMGRSAWHAVRAGRLATDSFVFIAAAFAVAAIWATANFRPTSEVRFLIILLSAMAYSTAWSGRQASGKPGAPPQSES